MEGTSNLFAANLNGDLYSLGKALRLFFICVLVHFNFNGDVQTTACQSSMTERGSRGKGSFFPSQLSSPDPCSQAAPEAHASLAHIASGSHPHPGPCTCHCPVPGPGGLGRHPQLVVPAPQGFLAPPPSELGRELLESQDQLIALYFLEGPSRRKAESATAPRKPVGVSSRQDLVEG